MKFENEIPKQTRVTLRKPCHLQTPNTGKANMAARRLLLKWYCWKSVDFFPYVPVMCQRCLYWIFKTKLKLESGNRKIQYACQVAILKVTSLKINRLLSIATCNIWNLKLKFQNKLELRPCRPQTDRQTDRRTRWIQYDPHLPSRWKSLSPFPQTPNPTPTPTST